MQISIIQIDYNQRKKEICNWLDSIFNSVEVSNGIICSNHNKFSKLYKMAVSFKLNNGDFLPLPFPSISKPVSSFSASLSFTTAYKPFSHNVNIGSSKSFAIAINTPISRFFHILQGNLFPICNRFYLLSYLQFSNQRQSSVYLQIRSCI